MPTPIFLTGFEHGLVSALDTALFAAVTGSATIETTAPVRSGSRALEISAALNTAESVGAANIGAGRRVIAERFYVNFPTSLPSDNETIALLVDANGSAALTFIQASARIAATIGGAGSQTAAVTLVPDTWYRIDVRFAVGTARSGGSSGTSYLDFQVDGVAATQVTRAQTDADITSVLIGTTSVSHAATTWRADDWFVSATDADYPIGVGQVDKLLPDADGTHSPNPPTALHFKDAAGTDISAGNVAWDNLNALPFGQTTTYVEQPVDASTEFLEVTTGPTITDVGTINGVRAVCSIWASTTGANLADTRVTENGTTRGSPTGAAYDASEVAPRYRGFLVTGFTDVNDLDWRVGFGTLQPGNPRFAGLVIEVDHRLGNAAVTPTTRTAAAFALAPTVAANAGATQATTVPATASALTPAVALTAGATPSTATAAATANIPTVAAVQTASVTPTTVTATGSPQTPALAGNAEATPGVRLGAASALTPTVSGTAGVAPTTATGTATGLTPDVVAVATAQVTPTTATATAGALTPAVSGNAGATPGTKTVPATALAPTVAGAAGAAPGTKTAVAAALTPAVAGNAQVALSTHTALAEALTPTVQAGGNVSVQPSSAEAVADALTPTVVAVQTASVTPATWTATATGFVPTVAGNASVALSTHSATSSANTPTVTATGNASVTPTTWTVIGAALAPTVTAGTDAHVAPAMAAVVASAFTPTVSGLASVTPVTMAAAATALTPTVAFLEAGSVVVTPPTASATATVLLGRVLTRWRDISFDAESAETPSTWQMDEIDAEGWDMEPEAGVWQAADTAADGWDMEPVPGRWEMEVSS